MEESSYESNTTSRNDAHHISGNDHYFDELVEKALGGQFSNTVRIENSCSSDATNFQAEDCQKMMIKFRLNAFTTNERVLKRKKLKMATKTQSTSLFDLFTTSSLSLQKQNIRDVLESPKSSLLESCYAANIDDLIMGFNTTELEIEQLTTLIFDQLVLESSSIVYNEDLKTSYLDLHLKWMNDCVKVEECHSFAFMILRNTILSLQHVKSLKNKEYVVVCILKMLKIYINIWNDGIQFQKSAILISYFMIETFVKQQKLDITTITLLAYHDSSSKLFSRLLSCISSTLTLRGIVLKTKFVESLYSIVSDTLNTGKKEKSSHEGHIDHKERERKLLRYLVGLIHFIFTNLGVVYSSQFSVPKKDSMETNVLTLEQGIGFLRELEECKDQLESIEKLHDVELLLRPFFDLIDKGLDPQLSYLFHTKLIGIVQATIVQIIICSLNDSFVLQKVSDILQQRLIKISHMCNSRCSEKAESVLFHVDDSNFVRLSPAPNCLFQILKYLLMNPQYASHELEKHMPLIVSCLQQLLDVSQKFGQIEVTSWNDLVSIMLLFTLLEKQNEPYLYKAIVSFIVEYETRTSQQYYDVETMLLLYCLLTKFVDCGVHSNFIKNNNLKAKVKSHCYGLYLGNNNSTEMKIDYIQYNSIFMTLHPLAAQAPLIRGWVKELVLAKALKDEIATMLNSMTKP